MGESRFNVQCMCGYVGTAPAGSELEARCKARSERYLDALTINPEECPDCEYDRERQERLAIEFDLDLL